MGRLARSSHRCAHRKFFSRTSSLQSGPYRRCPQYSVTKQGNVSLSPNATFCVVQSSPVPRLTSVFTIILAVVVLSLERACSTVQVFRPVFQTDPSAVVIATFLIRHRSLKDLLSQSKAIAVRVFLFTGVVLTAAVYVSSPVSKGRQLTILSTGLAFAMTDRRGGAFDVLMAMSE